MWAQPMIKLDRLYNLLLSLNLLPGYLVHLQLHILPPAAMTGTYNSTVVTADIAAAVIQNTAVDLPDREQLNLVPVRA